MQDERNLAQLALTLLKRVQLTGEEVPAYVQVHNWLEAKQQATSVTPAEAKLHVDRSFAGDLSPAAQRQDETTGQAEEHEAS